MPAQTNDPLIALLKERGLIDDLQLEEVMEEHTRSGKLIGTILADFGIMDTETQLQIIAEYLGTEVVDLREVEFKPETLKTIPASSARMYQCLPLEDYGSTLKVALADPMNPSIADELAYVIRKEIQPVVADPAQIQAAIEKHYSTDDEGFEDVLKQLGADADIAKEAAELEKAEDVTSNLADMADAAPIVRFVNVVLYQAIQDRASDIHFEPFEDEFKIRYRVDGALYEMAPPPKYLAMPVISRIKVVANLDIAERRLPQDGRISMMIAGKEIDLRVSTLPTRFGESVVLRVLDRSAAMLDLEALGFPDFVHDFVVKTIEQPNGIFIVTGPTGCGKTTTLYACLRRVNTIDVKVLTAEDPVEYDLEGIMQVAVHEATGMTFGKALRAFLRQDPDIILVGEIRDLETAEIAIKAAQTGHMVLSTLHTNDAPKTLTRLVNMGVAPFNIASAVLLIVAQRLARRLCPNCKKPQTLPKEALLKAGFKEADLRDLRIYMANPDGCDNCTNGYKGRVGIYQVMPISEGIASIIMRNGTSLDIEHQARKDGIPDLRESGLKKVRDGLTSLEEIERVTNQ